MIHELLLGTTNIIDKSQQVHVNKIPSISIYIHIFKKCHYQHSGADSRKNCIHIIMTYSRGENLFPLHLVEHIEMVWYCLLSPFASRWCGDMFTCGCDGSSLRGLKRAMEGPSFNGPRGGWDHMIASCSEVLWKFLGLNWDMLNHVVSRHSSRDRHQLVKKVRYLN